MKDFTSSKNLFHLLQQTINRFPHRPALQIEEQHQLRTYNYEDLWNAILHFEKKLKGLGIQSGMRIILLSENKPELIIAYFAILACEATAVLLDTSLEPEDYQELITHADPVLILVTTKLQNKLELISKVCTFNMDTETAVNSPITNHQSGDNDSSTATILYTSGTTGKFKGVLLSHENFISSIEAALSLKEIHETDSVLCVLPAYHVFGLVCALLIPLIAGAKISFVEKIQGDVILNTLRNAQCTILFAVPRLLELFSAGILNQIAQKNYFLKQLILFLSKHSLFFRKSFEINLGKFIFKKIHRTFGGKLRLIISGGAALDKKIFYGLESFGFTLVEGYGLTETASLVTVNPIKKRRPHTVGIPVSNVEIKLFNTHSTGEGEIIIRGNCVMQGYFRDLEATRFAIRNNWFHTGDLGKFDSHGHLTITGRIKEVIVKANGEKAMPEDVEHRYKNISNVSELAIVGIPHKKLLGEEIHAAIVLDKNLNTLELQNKVKKLINERSQHVPPHLRIQECHFIEALPKTTTLKVKRKILAQQLIAQRALDNSTAAKTESTSPYIPESDVAEKIKLLISKILNTTSDVKISKIKPEFSLQFDLGFDSLSRIELIQSIQSEFGICFNEQQLSVFYTVNDLIRAVHNLRESSDNKLFSPEIAAPWFEKLALDNSLEHSKVTYVYPQSKIKKTIRSLVNKWATFYFKLQSEGGENIPRGVPVIFCPNHSSHLDGICLAAVYNLPLNQLLFMAAKDYFVRPLLRIHLLKYLINLVPFERNRETIGLIENLHLCKQLVAKNNNLVIFPEATRTQDGKLQDFKSGAAMIAYEIGIPIVPVSITGTYNCLPKGKLFPRRGKVKIRFGKPLDIQSYRSEFSKQHNYQAYKKISQDLRENIEELMGNSQIN